MMGWSTFDDIKTYMAETEKKYFDINDTRIRFQKRSDHLQKLIDAYKLYEPYIKYNKELWSKTGREFKQYKKQHMEELTKYDIYRERLKDLITEPDKKIQISKWKEEYENIQNYFVSSKDELNGLVTGMAVSEVLLYNKDYLKLMLENESHKKRDLHMEREIRDL